MRAKFIPYKDIHTHDVIVLTYNGRFANIIRVTNVDALTGAVYIDYSGWPYYADQDLIHTSTPMTRNMFKYLLIYRKKTV